MEISVWDVCWRIDGVGSTLCSRVTLTNGRTTMNDIPKIIAIKRGIDEKHVIIYRLDRY